MVRFRSYCFGYFAGRPFQWFAWYPVKTQSGQWLWMRTVCCVLVSKRPYLDGPNWEFYAYILKEPEP
jgi:hypothetical protein